MRGASAPCISASAGRQRHPNRALRWVQASPHRRCAAKRGAARLRGAVDLVPALKAGGVEVVLHGLHLIAARLLRHLLTPAAARGAKAEAQRAAARRRQRRRSAARFSRGGRCAAALRARRAPLGRVCGGQKECEPGDSAPGREREADGRSVRHLRHRVATRCQRRPSSCQHAGRRSSRGGPRPNGSVGSHRHGPPRGGASAAHAHRRAQGDGARHRQRHCASSGAERASERQTAFVPTGKRARRPTLPLQVALRDALYAGSSGAGRARVHACAWCALRARMLRSLAAASRARRIGLRRGARKSV